MCSFTRGRRTNKTRLHVISLVTHRRVRMQISEYNIAGSGFIYYHFQILIYIVCRHREAARTDLDDDKFLMGIYPASLGHVRIVRRCRHGIFRKPRGTGQRTTKSSDFVKCNARITASAVYDEDVKKWVLETREEVCMVNPPSLSSCSSLHNLFL